ncbi:MAG: hypothetical protein IPP85_13115 [Propionivibrio sp.]|nr:hypothetical protein [Propionivibrio sp.]
MNQPPDSPPRSRRFKPVGIALLYAAFGALWIVASGLLLTFSVDDPVLQGRIELAKGLLFVVVTSSLLYLVLKHCETDPTLGGPARRSAGHWKPAAGQSALAPAGFCRFAGAGASGRFCRYPGAGSTTRA